MIVYTECFTIWCSTRLGSSLTYKIYITQALSCRSFIDEENKFYNFDCRCTSSIVQTRSTRTEYSRNSGKQLAITLLLQVALAWSVVRTGTGNGIILCFHSVAMYFVDFQFRLRYFWKMTGKFQFGSNRFEILKFWTWRWRKLKKVNITVTW